MYASLITLSFLSTIITYTIVVIDALQSGNKNKETCILRSSLVGFVHGVFYTRALNSYTYGHLAVRYHIVSLAPRELVINSSGYSGWDGSNGSSSTLSSSIWNISWFVSLCSLYEKNTCKSVPED